MRGSAVLLDRYVTEQVLAAVAPAALEVSVQAAGQAEAERDALDRLWHQRIERAWQATDRARRQYQLAKPEHRLVVRHLEQQWEQALADLDRLTAAYQLSAEHRDRRGRSRTGPDRQRIAANGTGRTPTGSPHLRSLDTTTNPRAATSRRRRRPHLP